MCKFIGKSNERILCNLSKSEILRLYPIVHVAMETMKTSHFTHQSKSFISIFFTRQVSSCELRRFSCPDWQMTYTYKLPKLCSATITISKLHLDRHNNRPFPRFPGPLFQNDMEIIFRSHANKTHFHKKGCAPSLILKVKVSGTRKWPILLVFHIVLRN